MNVSLQSGKGPDRACSAQSAVALSRIAVAKSGG